MWSPVCSQFCNPQSIWYENKKDMNKKKFDKKCLRLFKKEMKSFFFKVYRKFKNIHSAFTLFSNIQYNNLCLWYYQKKSQETTNARNDARNDIVTTANSVNLPIISKIKVLILNVQSMKFHHHETQKKSDSNYLENEWKHLP